MLIYYGNLGKVDSHLWTDCLENVGASTSHNRIGLHGLLLSCTHEAECTPFQTHCFSEKLVAPGIDPGTSGSVARNSGHQTTEAVNNNDDNNN
jgi:hypothetical protein